MSFPRRHDRPSASLAKPLVVAALPTVMLVGMGIAYLRHEATIAEQQLREEAERFGRTAALRLEKAYGDFLESEEVLLRAVELSTLHQPGLSSPRPRPEDSAAFGRFLEAQSDRARLKDLVPELAAFHTPAGLPLEPVAWLQLARLCGAEGDREDALESLRKLLSSVVETKPSLVSEQFLAAAETLATSLEIGERLDLDQWRSAFLAKEETRTRIRRQVASRTVGRDASPWFIDEGGRFYRTMIQRSKAVVFSKEELQALAGEALAEVWPLAENGPKSLAIDLSFEKEPLVPTPFDDPTVRQAKFEESGFAHIARRGMGEMATAGTGLPFSVRVFVADRAAFRKTVQDRIVRIGVVLSIATGCLVVGFWRTWETLVFQRTLNERQSNLIACLSHELRSPVAGIRLLVERLAGEGRGFGDPRSRDYVRMVAKETDRLAGLIDRILDTGQIAEGKKQYDFQWIDLLALVRDSAERYATLAEEEGKRVLCNSDTGELHLRGDSVALQQALGNLIDNALKFSGAGGEVIVSAWSAPSEGTVLVSVKDRGRGIEAEEIPNIFDLFYRSGAELRRETTGTGLGLFLVKEIVEAHGGRVEVDSEPGVGSEFRLVFPQPAKEPD